MTEIISVVKLLSSLTISAVIVLLSGLSLVHGQINLVQVGWGYATNQQNGLARAVAVKGNYAYLANNEDGLRVFNISDPCRPLEVGHYSSGWPGFSYDVCLSGSYLYLANGFDGLRIFDASDPENLSPLGHAILDCPAVSVTVRSNIAYLPCSDGGLNILDVTNPNQPTFLAQTNNGGNADSVALSGDYAFLANRSDGLRVYDVTQPGTPINVGHTNINPFVSLTAGAVAIKIRGSYAYVAHESWGFQIYDISEPAVPRWINGMSFGSMSTSLALSEDGRYVFVGVYPNGLRMCSVTNPNDIQLIATTYEAEFPYGVTCRGNYVYVADGPRGLRIFLVQPNLTIAQPSPDTITLSWPVPIASGVFLQSTPSLAAPYWVNLTNIPTELDGQKQITFTPTAASGFFRLNFTQ